MGRDEGGTEARCFTIKDKNLYNFITHYYGLFFEGIVIYFKTFMNFVVF